MSKEFLWVEKYRPNIVEDCILPDSIKNVFQGFVNQGELPNLLLSVERAGNLAGLCNNKSTEILTLRFCDRKNAVAGFAPWVCFKLIALGNASLC